MMVPMRMAAAALALLLAGCAAATEPTDGALEIDNCGRTLSIGQPVERVLAIGGEAGSIVWAAGGADLISTFAPLAGEPLGAAGPALAAREQLPLNSNGEISREAIIAANPDLVVTFGLNTTTYQDLESVGIPTYFVSGYCGRIGAEPTEEPFELLFGDIAAIGRILGTEATAQASVAELRERVAQVERAAADAPARSAAALFVVDPASPIGAYGNRGTADQQLRLLGLRNVFGDVTDRYFEVGPEQLIGAAPQVVIALHQADTTTPEQAVSIIADNPALASIPAVAENRIIPLDFFYTGHGVLAVDGLEMLARELDLS